MTKNINDFLRDHENDILTFASRLVSTMSYSCHEKDAIDLARKTMLALGYNQILEDSSGSLIGVLGDGDDTWLFDAHIDTVKVLNPEEWTTYPLSGIIKDKKLYGRGATDNKGNVAAVIYAGYAMKELGLLKGKTIYIAITTMEEMFDGLALCHALNEHHLRPQHCVICEPSHMNIVLGQKGRTVFHIRTNGVSAHGSSPEEGKNAIFMMNSVLERVRRKGKALQSEDEPHGSLTVTGIQSETVSMNSVPRFCDLWLDRRSTAKDTADTIHAELDGFCEGLDASWDVMTLTGMSYANLPVKIQNHFMSWHISEDDPLTGALSATYKVMFQKEPQYREWNMSTSGVATGARLGLPTIGFGCGYEKRSHMTDEYCKTDDIVKAAEFYTRLIAMH